MVPTRSVVRKFKTESQTLDLCPDWSGQRLPTDETARRKAEGTPQRRVQPTLREPTVQAQHPQAWVNQPAWREEARDAAIKYYSRGPNKPERDLAFWHVLPFHRRDVQGDGETSLMKPQRSRHIMQRGQFDKEGAGRLPRMKTGWSTRAQCSA